MKLEKFKRKNNKKKIIIIGSAVLFLLIAVVIMYRSFAFFESIQEFNIIKGSVPEQDYDLMLSLTQEIGGIKQTINTIPKKESGTTYEVEVTCDNTDGYWDYQNWNVVVNVQEFRTKCKINFKENNNFQYPFFENIEEGKKAIANAISQKGISTSATATLSQMANNIKNINTTKQPAFINFFVGSRRLSFNQGVTAGKHYLIIYAAVNKYANAGWSNGDYSLSGGNHVKVWENQKQTSGSPYTSMLVAYVTATSGNIYFSKDYGNDGISSGGAVILRLD